MTVDDRLSAQWAAEKARRRGGPPLAPPPSGPQPPSMTELAAKVAVLEQIAKDTKDALTGLKAEMSAMRTDVTATRVDVAEMKGKVSGLPTTWNMVIAVVGPLIAFAGLGLTFFRFFRP